jgi:putative protease
MNTIRPIELLSPAKDLACGIEAINHGADAVYIGAPKFGARAAAGNTLEDIQTLCAYAHRFRVKIYVALNTILTDEELPEAEKLIWELYEAGVDALIVQDMGITQLNLPDMALHASTQTDNRTAARVRFLEESGFTQVVLARELSLNEIRTIKEQTTVPLEAFVHGSLCVSYSGQCYLSAALSGRSANRGECAQYCRLPYTMLDAEGVQIAKSKHLLSLKDMNRSEHLLAMLEAGISSFKIEGRLKDSSYVKNVTAFYRKKIDAVIKKYPERYARASSGVTTFTFEPELTKSFNRGFTDYYLRERSTDISDFNTPKSIGEKVGTVKEMRGNSFTVAGFKQLNNGDGLAFFNESGVLEGFRVNKVEENRVFPLDMPAVKPKTVLYRNYDHEFEKTLAHDTAVRKIAISIHLTDTESGFSLTVKDEDNNQITLERPLNKELAKRDQEENMRTQLAKLGGTAFSAQSISIAMEQNWFMPSSVLADMRRLAVEALEQARCDNYKREPKGVVSPDLSTPLNSELTYLGNVYNSKAKQFYAQRGVTQIAPAFELESVKDVPLMFTKHCLRYSMGWCPMYQKGQSPYKEPYYLMYKDTKIRLQFDCKQCQMLLYYDKQVKE